MITTELLLHFLSSFNFENHANFTVCFLSSSSYKKRTNKLEHVQYIKCKPNFAVIKDNTTERSSCSQSCPPSCPKLEEAKSLEKSYLFHEKQNITLVICKGQLISKGLFGVIVWTKNPTKIF